MQAPFLSLLDLWRSKIAANVMNGNPQKGECGDPYGFLLYE